MNRPPIEKTLGELVAAGDPATINLVEKILATDPGVIHLGDYDSGTRDGRLWSREFSDGHQREEMVHLLGSPDPIMTEMASICELFEARWPEAIRLGGGGPVKSVSVDPSLLYWQGFRAGVMETTDG